MSDADMIFGDIIRPIIQKAQKPTSPRTSIGSDRPLAFVSVSKDANDRRLPTGMGVKDEAMGLLAGGKGLKEIAQLGDEI